MESLGLTLPSSPFKLGDVKVFLMPESVASNLGKSADRNVYFGVGIVEIQLVFFHHFFSHDARCSSNL
jgi:hypothetical protein